RSSTPTPYTTLFRSESQVPYPYTVEQLQAIRASISEPRFATYLKKGGNHQEYALALYLYNARVAKAFLYPLNVAEVTLRNAVDRSEEHTSELQSREN